jgi:hypothetical protein
MTKAALNCPAQRDQLHDDQRDGAQKQYVYKAAFM